MFGPPDDVEGQCNARLYLADDYGDNSATMRCSLSSSHEGLHEERFSRSGFPVIVQWEKDERSLEEGV